MRKSSKLFLLGLLATVALSLTAGTAAANRSLQVEPAGAARMTTRALTFAEPEGVNIISEVTMTGSLHRSISKARGSLVGFVTRVDTANCRTSAFATSCVAEARLNLPWHIRFESFSGTLPNITGVTVSVVGSFLISIRPPFGIPVRECLYRGSISGRTNNPITTLTVQPNRVPLERDLLGNGCPLTGELIGTFAVSPTQRLRLV